MVIHQHLNTSTPRFQFEAELRLQNSQHPYVLPTSLTTPVVRSPLQFNSVSTAKSRFVHDGVFRYWPRPRNLWVTRAGFMAGIADHPHEFAPPFPAPQAGARCVD